jgi:hypothetical protein
MAYPAGGCHALRAYSSRCEIHHRWSAVRCRPQALLSASPERMQTPCLQNAYVRWPQPALYTDLKTGATWSGRAPAWLTDVKDRSKFLIAGAGEGKA